MNQYSPFNRWKALFHREHLEAISRDDFLPPYWVATDPSNACTDACIYCNARQYRESTDNCFMSRGHLLTLAEFYRDWGIQATIIEGGGEPLTNPELPDFLRRLDMYDIESGIITNGYKMKNEYTAILPEVARFVGISVDAAHRETYYKMRGVTHFEDVIGNIESLNKVRGDLDVRIKMLIHPYNYKEIYDFAKMARDLGCTGAHIKPIASEGVEGMGKIDFVPLMPEINTQIEAAKELETDTFSVDAVTYKFDQQYRKVVRFNKCRCTPLGGVFGADGWFHLCYNMRGRDGFRLVRHDPDPYAVKRIWNTKYHKTMIANIIPADCMRCGLTQYNEIIENCIQQDKMFRRFP